MVDVSSLENSPEAEWARPPLTGASPAFQAHLCRPPGCVCGMGPHPARGPNWFTGSCRPEEDPRRRGPETSPMSGFALRSTKPLAGAQWPGVAGVVCGGIRDPSMELGGVGSAAPCGLGPWDQPGDAAGREVAAESPQTSNLRPQSTSSRSSGVTGAAAWRLSPALPSLAGACPLQSGCGGKVTMSSGGGEPGCLLGPDVCCRLEPGLRGVATLRERTLLAPEGRQVHPHVQQCCPVSGSARTPPSLCATVQTSPA